MDEKNLSVSELAACVGGVLIGDDKLQIHSVADVTTAKEGQIAYVEEQKFFPAATASKASCLIVPPGTEINVACRIEVRRPKLAFALIAELLHPLKKRQPALHSTAVVASSASVGADVYLGPHVVVEEHASIGRGTRIEAGAVVGAGVRIGCDCVLYPNVVLYDGVAIGDRVVLHAGVCIGADGFGYVRDELAYHKFPQIGTVVIEDDVELGAFTCVDRGALGHTRIGKGTKLDNAVHVGHNCDIGERVVIAAQTGISGSVTIENDCVIGGQVGFGDHIRVQSGAVIGSKAGVLPGKIVRPGVWWGIPIQPLAEYKRLNAQIGRLPRMLDEIRKLRARLETLEAQLKQ